MRVFRAFPALHPGGASLRLCKIAPSDFVAADPKRWMRVTAPVCAAVRFKPACLIRDVENKGVKYHIFSYYSSLFMANYRSHRDAHFKESMAAGLKAEKIVRSFSSTFCSASRPSSPRRWRSLTRPLQSLERKKRWPSRPCGWSGRGGCPRLRIDRE